MTWDEHLIYYFNSLQPPQLPSGFHWLLPHRKDEVKKVVDTFCRKYFQDANERTLFLGINPGRLGAGITGVNFTAPKQLKEVLHIDHPFGEGTELSAGFIYEVIAAYGGAQAFYSHFFLGSVCPLGLVKDGKNINYYDDRELAASLQPFIIRSMETLLQGYVNRETCICIGGEKNYAYLSRLNGVQQWFRNIIHVPHPRFIMQYRRKEKDQFIQQYLQSMQEAARHL